MRLGSFPVERRGCGTARRLGLCADLRIEIEASDLSIRACIDSDGTLMNLMLTPRLLSTYSNLTTGSSEIGIEVEVVRTTYISKSNGLSGA